MQRIEASGRLDRRQGSLWRDVVVAGLAQDAVGQEGNDRHRLIMDPKRQVGPRGGRGYRRSV
ncbi:hypothetical protein D3C80_1977530 [compost metagenome]